MTFFGKVDFDEPASRAKKQQVWLKLLIKKVPQGYAPPLYDVK